MRAVSARAGRSLNGFIFRRACNDAGRPRAKSIGAATSTRSRVSRGSDNDPAAVSSPHRRLKESCVCAVSYNFLDLIAAFPGFPGWTVKRTSCCQQIARKRRTAYSRTCSHPERRINHLPSSGPLRDDPCFTPQRLLPFRQPCSLIRNDTCRESIISYSSGL